jgi:hypothetical protein
VGAVAENSRAKKLQEGAEMIEMVIREIYSQAGGRNTRTARLMN